MACRQCLVLHRSKWEDLQKRSGQIQTDKEATIVFDKREYYNALDEQSKAWKRNWPDTVEGCLAKVEARKKKQVDADKAFVKAFEEKLRQQSTGHAKAVADAKREIFNTSNYGQQLIRAVRESKAIEERKAQIDMKKFMKDKGIEYDEYVTAQIASLENNHFDLAKKDDERAKRRKLAQIEQAKINKMIHEYKEQEIVKAREKEKLEELEDARLQKMNLEFEKHEMDHCKEKVIEESKQYEADCKVIKEEKMQRDQEDEALVAMWAEYHDTVWCKEKKAWEKIIKGRGESQNYKKAYEMTEKALEDNKKAYETLVDKGLEKLKKSQTKAEDNEHKAKQLKNVNYRKELAEDYKTALEVKEILKHCNKCYCDKQSLFTKPAEMTVKKVIGGDERDTYKPESFLAPYTRLSDELKKRSNAPTPWTAQSGEHKYFAEQAAAAIKECKYKYMARKVVDVYKKCNNLDSATLPAPDCECFCN